jgi:uridine kinase
MVADRAGRAVVDRAEQTADDRRGMTLGDLGAAISEARRPEKVVLVAIDGVDGAGKTVFADELADVLKRQGIVVLRGSVDGFHHPPSIRYRRGRRSPEGFFLDSYDYGALRRLLLEPLMEPGERRVVRRVYDVHAEKPVEADPESAADVEVLVFDGIFLHRPELRDLWDLSIFLEVDFEVSVPRGAGRGYGDPDPTAASNRRYVEGQRRYLASCQPRDRATWVIDNNVLAEAHLSDGALD